MQRIRAGLEEAEDWREQLGQGHSDLKNVPRREHGPLSGQIAAPEAAVAEEAAAVAAAAAVAPDTVDPDTAAGSTWAAGIVEDSWPVEEVVEPAGKAEVVGIVVHLPAGWNTPLNLNVKFEIIFKI